MTLRIVVPFALACGLLAAFASSVRAQGPPPVLYPTVAPAFPATLYIARCAPRKQTAVKPPSQAVFDAFGVLRRERTDADTLSAKAMQQLKRRGITLADPNSARLLRQTASGGRAWVVPVADLRALLRGPRLICNPKAGRGVERRPRARRLRPARRIPTPKLPRRVPPPSAAPIYAAPVPFAPVPFAPLVDLDKPQEGLIVIAEGGAPVGVGGVHKQLIRGLVSPSVRPCAGPKRDLVSVSGIVPDGVGSAFLTSADGTAIKADVKDNAYEFLVPPAKGREAHAPRYVVWVGGDGTPHVQPVALSRLPTRLCRALSRRPRGLIELSPGFGFDIAPTLVVPSRALPPPRPRRP